MNDGSSGYRENRCLQEMFDEVSQPTRASCFAGRERLFGSCEVRPTRPFVASVQLKRSATIGRKRSPVGTAFDAPCGRPRDEWGALQRAILGRLRTEPVRSNCAAFSATTMRWSQINRLLSLRSVACLMLKHHKTSLCLFPPPKRCSLAPSETRGHFLPVPHTSK
jgi:hypothetical protein